MKEKKEKSTKWLVIKKGFKVGTIMFKLISFIIGVAITLFFVWLCVNIGQWAGLL